MSGTKPMLLYIASNGRSGSTLLEMLLNVSPQLWTLGEFHVLPWEIRENNKPCGCGSSVERCELWGPVIAEHRDVLLRGSIDRFRRTYNVDRTLRIAELPSLLTGRLRSNPHKMAEVHRYAEENRRVLEAVRSRATQLGRSSLAWLVDASKSPYRLLWLAASGQFELRVIHLVKDPRAFAYSVSKHSTGISQAYRVARAAARWQVENRLFGVLAQQYLIADQVFQLRYEQLAAHTDETLGELADWLNIRPWSGARDVFREKNHGISGNPSRFESRGIQLDEQWKQKLPTSLQRLAFRCGRRLASQYGYTAT
jgi:hypothetical protein